MFYKAISYLAQQNDKDFLGGGGQKKFKYYYTRISFLFSNQRKMHFNTFLEFKFSFRHLALL